MSWSIPKEFVPRLRRDLKLRRLDAPPFVAALRDETFGTRYKLEATTARVVRAINGKRSMSRVLEHLNRTGQAKLEPEELCRVVAMLAAAALLEPPVVSADAGPAVGRPTVTWMAAAPDAVPPLSSVRLRFLPGARFGCQGSGMCCAGYDFVPVDDQVVTAVRAHRFTPAIQRGLGRDPFDEVTLDDGRTVHAIRQEGSRCLFLDDDLQCAIHKEIGIDAKPAVCRAFPLTFALGPDGDCFVSFGMECGGFATGRACGAPLTERAEEIRALLARLPGLHRVPDPVPIRAAHEVPWSRYLDLERVWLEALDAPETSPAERLGVLCRRLVELEAGRESTSPAECESRRESRETLDTIDALRPLLERTLRHATIVARRHLSDREVLAAEVFMRVRIAAGLMLGLRDVVGEDLWPAATAHFDPPPGTRVAPSVDTLFDDLLRNQVFGKQLLQAPDLASGLGLAVLRFHLSSALAAVMGAHTRAGSVTAAHLNEGIRTVNRCLRPADARWLDPDRTRLAALVDAQAEAAR